MDKSTLVTEQIEAGSELIQQLAHGGFDVTAAFWFKGTEDNRWYFYVVSPIVDSEGLNQAYTRLHPFVWQMPQPFWIHPLEVKLIGPRNPIAKDVLEIYRRSPAPKGSAIRWRGKILGNVSIEEAYLYPLPNGVTV